MNTFQNQNFRKKEWQLNEIYVIMQQKQILKKSGVEFGKKVDLASSKSNVGKLDIDKLKNVPAI